MCLGDHIRTFTPQQVRAVQNDIHAGDGRMVDGRDGHWISKHFVLVYIVGCLPQILTIWTSSSHAQTRLRHATPIGSTGFKLSKLHYLRVKKNKCDGVKTGALYIRCTGNWRSEGTIFSSKYHYTTLYPKRTAFSTHESVLNHVKPTSCLNISYHIIGFTQGSARFFWMAWVEWLAPTAEEAPRMDGKVRRIQDQIQGVNL